MLVKIELLVFLVLLTVLIMVFKPVWIKLFKPSVPSPTNEYDNMDVVTIDALINQLKLKIESAELQASKGVDLAKERLHKYETQLKEAQAAKERISKL